MPTEKEIRVSKMATMNHILQVRRFLDMVSERLHERGLKHDLSKLESPEMEVFAEFTPRLAGTTYGSQMYQDYLKAMGPALEHHYAHNRHHPEHFKPEADATFRASPVNCMNLIDVMEMVCDWAAAVMRHDDGNLERSIDINSERFILSSQLTSILHNTIPLFKIGKG